MSPKPGVGGRQKFLFHGFFVALLTASLEAALSWCRVSSVECRVSSVECRVSSVECRVCRIKQLGGAGQKAEVCGFLADFSWARFKVTDGEVGLVRV
jgi:hypothetical protein